MSFSGELDGLSADEKRRASKARDAAATLLWGRKSRLEVSSEAYEPGWLLRRYDERYEGRPWQWFKLSLLSDGRWTCSRDGSTIAKRVLPSTRLDNCVQRYPRVR